MLGLRSPHSEMSCVLRYIVAYKKVVPLGAHPPVLNKALQGRNVHLAQHGNLWIAIAGMREISLTFWHTVCQQSVENPAPQVKYRAKCASWGAHR